MSRAVPAEVVARCDQNRLFACGASSRVPASLFTIGHDRLRVLGGGSCLQCGLPLAVYRDAQPSERALYDEF